MKRIIGLAVVITFTFATFAQAQTPSQAPAVKKLNGVTFVAKTPAPAAPAVKPRLTKDAIASAVASTIDTNTFLRRDRPIYKKAWPYVVGAIVVILLIWWHNRHDQPMAY